MWSFVDMSSFAAEVEQQKLLSFIYILSLPFLQGFFFFFFDNRRGFNQDTLCKVMCSIVYMEYYESAKLMLKGTCPWSNPLSSSCLFSLTGDVNSFLPLIFLQLVF